MFPLRVLAAALVAAALTASVEAQTPQALTVSSSALKAGETIPQDYTADGRNVSPPLQWSGAPASTKEFAVILDDPDVPMPQPFVHWVVYKIPATAKGLPENMPADAATPMPADLKGTIQGLSGFRRPMWRGPAPPKPGVAHQYHFIVYALDAPLEAAEGLNKPQLLEAMKGHIIGQGEIIATYERKPPQ